jgi:crotonobetainyl-CoA:carnitine CoA-transferase CaiB-like acyl-CoA transferase
MAGDRRARASPASIGDLTAGIFASLGILSALLAR